MIIFIIIADSGSRIDAQLGACPSPDIRLVCAPISQTLWMICQSTLWYCQIFLFISFPRVVTCWMAVEIFLIRAHNISISSSWWRLRGLPMGAFIIWLCLALRHFWMCAMKQTSTIVLYNLIYNNWNNHAVTDTQAYWKLLKAKASNSLIFDFK